MLSELTPMFNSLLNFIFPHRQQIHDLESDLFTLRNEIDSLKKDLFEQDTKVKTIPLSKEDRLLDFLKIPRTTTETAHYFAESRTWTSLQLNRLQRLGKIRVSHRSNKGKYYQTS